MHNNSINSDPKKLRCASLLGPVMAGVRQANGDGYASKSA